MKHQNDKGHGYFRKSKAYGLVSGIVLSLALLTLNNTVSADSVEDEVTSSSIDTELIVSSQDNSVNEGETSLPVQSVNMETSSSVIGSTFQSQANTATQSPVFSNVITDFDKTVSSSTAESVAPTSLNVKEDTDKVNFVVQIAPEVYDETISKIKELKDVDLRFEYKEIFTGASLRLSSAQVSDLLAIAGVTKVEKSQRYYPQMLKTQELINGLKLSKKYEHDGRGMVIAVVDSGIDTRHKDMRLDEGVVPKIKEITKTVENEFTMKVPHGYNFMGKNYQLIDETEHPHGMHIAGILAGNATDKDLENNLGIDGIAPNAQLLSYKVFSDREDSQIAVIDDIVFAAIEDAIKHQADVISLSIGSYGTGKPSDAFYQAIRRAKEKGIVVVASIGNAGTSGSTTSYDRYTNEAFDQTDVSTTVSVAANLDVIGVGSSAHTYREGHTVRIGQQEFFYGPVSYSRFENGEYEIVDAGEATEEELSRLDLAGKVALIARSSESPKVQFDRLRAKGVQGVISYNTNTGRNRDYYKTELQHILEENVAKDIWGMTLSNNDGQKVKALLSSSSKQSLTYTGIKTKKEATRDEISGFSSWGSTVDLELKPEIVAPGESIYSTFNHNRYGIMSGTSMSTPVVAGASAILLPKFKTFNHPMNIADFTKIMMMNTADPLMDTTGLENSPRQQGAGMLNIQDAFDNHVLVTHKNKAFVALKEIKDDKVTFILDLENLSDEDESFKLRYSSVLTSGLLPIQKGDETVKEVHSLAIEGATIQSDSSNILLKPKEKKTVTLTVTTPSELTNQFVEGYIYLDSDTNPSLSIPYFGYKGDWQKDDIIDRPMWEDKSKTKLTTLMTTSSLSHQKYVPLGLKNPKDQAEGVNPDFVAISSTLTGRVTGSAFLRMAVLRDLVDFEVDVVDQASDDAVALTVLQRGKFLEKFRYVDYFENDYFSKKYLNPEEGIYWDGRVYDASTGEKVAAKEGQYYVRIKARNDLNKPYQTTYLPVKVDNTAPKAQLDTTGSLNVTVSDNTAIWYVDAKIGETSYKVVKAAENRYQILDVPEMSSADLTITVVDIAGNPVTLTHPLTRPALVLSNLDDIKSKRRETTLTAIKRDDVTSLIVKLDGREVKANIDDNEVSIDLDKLTDGEHQLSYQATTATGEVVTEEMSFTRDVTAPTVEWDVAYDDEEEYLTITDGYALIKGRVSDAVSPSDKISIYYYLNKDRHNQEKKTLVKPDANGHFEVKIYLSDYPEAVTFEVVDEANRKETKIFQTQEPKEEEVKENPITVHLDRTNYFFKEENLGDNLHQDEKDKDLFIYNLDISSDEADYSIKVNGSDFITFDEDGELSHQLPLRSGANIVDIEGYDAEKNLILQRKYFFFVDIEMPKYDFENFAIRPVLPDETDSSVKGTIYIPSERFTFKGTAEDNGLEWSLFINDSIARRGKAWREFGFNKESFAFETILQDNDFLKLRLVDYFGNAENDNYTKYRVKVDKEKPVIHFEPVPIYKHEAIIDVAFTDNSGLTVQQLYLDGKEMTNKTKVTGLGGHHYLIKAIDYAGNETILEGHFTIVGDLKAKPIKTAVTEEELPKLETWLALEEGTKATLLAFSENKASVKLSNGLEEKTVVYDIELVKTLQEAPSTTEHTPTEKLEQKPDTTQVEEKVDTNQDNASITSEATSEQADLTMVDNDSQPPVDTVATMSRYKARHQDHLPKTGERESLLNLSLGLMLTGLISMIRFRKVNKN